MPRLTAATGESSFSVAQVWANAELRQALGKPVCWLEGSASASGIMHRVQSRRCHDFEPMFDDFRPRRGLSRPARSADHLKVGVPFL